MGTLPTAESLPAAIVTREQWVAWQTKDRDGKATKVPVDPGTGQFASATDAETWSDFATAREYATSSATGVGFVFTEDDPIVGVDLDDCRDPEDGSLADWARDIIVRLDSFTEVSPSGTGVHVLVEGDLPEGRNRHGDVELYDDARFFTVTGDHMSETPGTIEARQDALSGVHSEYVAQDDPSDTMGDDVDSAAASDATAVADSEAEPSTTGPGNDLDDGAILSRARSASNGKKFQRLWKGNIAGYPSQSEADMALCSLLAFWTGGDVDQMDRLFRESGLLRPKWDEQHYADGTTYGERTIERAIAGTDEFYSGSPAGRDDTSSTTDLGSASAVSQESAHRSSRDETDSETDGVPIEVVEELETELQRVQAENEELRAELEAERERRQELEMAVESESADESSGWLTRLFGR
jgi:primase-polymerase (primpol)-like protein